MSLPVLNIGVVGHTNTGKTSLVRTLTQNRSFGTVEDRGGTTRAVSGLTLEADGSPLLRIYDSPGLENAPALLEYMEHMGSERHDGPARLRRFLDKPEARQAFDHEARVIELTLTIDVILYVVDVREPVLEKYQDELAVLGYSARPMIAVLNFVADQHSREAAWREALARVRLHTVVAFDARVRDFATEEHLYAKLRAQLDAFAPTLDAWLVHRRKEEREREAAARLTIAELLVDVAAARRLTLLDRRGQPADSLAELRDAVRRREHVCVETLLALYAFGTDDYEDDELPLENGYWPDDLFSAETLRRHSLRTGSYAGLGAGIGAAVDIGTGGLSLGAGTALGTLLGGGTGVSQSLGPNLWHRWRGQAPVCVDDETLLVLATRQVYLLDELRARGHGSPGAVRGSDYRQMPDRDLLRSLRNARRHPRWSSLNETFRDSSGRTKVVQAITETLTRKRQQSVPDDHPVR